MVFSRSAKYYDAVYSFKDYTNEAANVSARIRARLGPGRLELLDVACGTGLHLQHLQGEFDVEGLDLDEGLLAVARERLPGVPLHAADMIAFDLGRRFDVVTCLFSSIGYVRTEPSLRGAIACMARHVKPGGLLLVEPWFTPEGWKPPRVDTRTAEREGFTVSRMSYSSMRGSISIVDFHYLVGTREGVEHLEEHHEMGLFTREMMEGAFGAAGLAVEYDAEGIFGRGLYVGSTT